MRQTLVAALAAVLAAACGGSSGSSADLQTQSKNALPSSSNVKMKGPQSAGSSADSGALQDSVVGDASGYFVLTVGLSGIVNGAAAVTLGVIEAITASPATNCDTTTNTCTWGPGSSALDANNYKLSVTKQADGSFKYGLSGQSKASASGPFVTFLSGTAIPSGTPHVGSGELVIDNDARAQLPGASGDTGKVTIDYANTSQLTISATAIGAKDNDHPGQKINVGYQYANHADGGGDLDVAFKNTTSLATYSIHSRWLATGAGRGDAKVTVPVSGGTFSAQESECWSAAASAFKVVYFNSDDHSKGTSGSASACAYSDVSFGTVAAP